MKTVLTVVMIVGMLALINGAVLAQTGNDLFQQALVKERTEGNLPEAIKLYQTIVQKYGSDRKLAAKALFQMGQAYEKLGNPEARKTYERIAREFIDQKEVAADAARRLAVLTAPPASDKPTPQVVLTSENSDESVSFNRRWMSISLDGRWMAVTRWSGAGNELAVQDMSTRQLKRLLVGSCEARQYDVPRAGPPCSVSALPTLSPDSRQIVYTWHDPAEIEGQGQLRVVANEAGAKPRVLVRNGEFDIYGWAWTPDTKSILVTTVKKDGTWQVGWVAVADGRIKVLKSLQWRFLPGQGDRLSLSPDGRYITYSALAVNPRRPIAAPWGPGPAATNPRDRHIYILAADGSSDVAVVKTAGVNNRSPVWTADGNIVYTSNLSGKSDLWSVAVRDGKVTGSPSMVRRDIGDIDPIGMTQSGSYYFVQSRTDVIKVSIAELAPHGESRIVQNFVGGWPTWSPDGKSIAFTRDGSNVVVRNVETRDEKVYVRDAALRSAGPSKWFHDGKGLLYVLRPPNGVYFVDVKTEEFKQVLPPSERRAGSALSPDDTTLYFVAATNRPELIEERPRLTVLDRIISVELSGGQTKTVFMLPGKDETLPRGPFGSGIAISPDGRTLALSTINFKTSEAHLALVGVDGSNYHEIYGPYRAAGVDNKVAWTKDGRAIVFAVSADDGPRNWQIMRIGIEGGKPEFTGLAVRDLGTFDLSPEGSRIAFSAGAEASTSELLAIDHLPTFLKDTR